MVEMSLLELMAVQSQCEYLSDLRFLNVAQRKRLARMLETVVPQKEDLRDWNEALAYLNQGAFPADSAEEAKAVLIAGLSSARPDTPAKPMFDSGKDRK